MPDSAPTDPVLCDHRSAPWLPLCEHAGTIRAGDLTEDHRGRVVTASAGTGVLVAVHHLDDVATQLLLERGPGDVTVTDTPAGEVVRIGWHIPAGERVTWTGEDRRSGLPDSRPADDRAERRQDLLDRRERPSPEWSRRFLDRHLKRVEQHLANEGYIEASLMVRDIASSIRTGAMPLW